MTALDYSSVFTRTFQAGHRVAYTFGRHLYIGTVADSDGCTFLVRWDVGGAARFVHSREPGELRWATRDDELAARWGK